MSSLLKSLGNLINSSVDSFSTAGSADTPKVEIKNEHGEVEIDQIPPSDLLLEEKDCSACTDPCDDHKSFPPYLDFDRETPLLGSMSPYGRHFMIATAMCDWPARIEEDYGSLAANLHELVKENPMEWRTFITNTSMISKHATTYHCSMDIVVLPDNIIIGNVGPEDAQVVYDIFVKAPLPKKDTNSVEYFKTLDLKELGVYPNPYDSMVLICSHRKRDKRCGVTAPILSREFDHVLRELDIHDGEGGTTVLMVSHVGGKIDLLACIRIFILIMWLILGHKFAGNVICYVNKGLTGIWYGRVDPCDCRPIVEETIIKKKVIKNLYRGSMNHSFGSDKCNRIKW